MKLQELARAVKQQTLPARRRDAREGKNGWSWVEISRCTRERVLLSPDRRFVFSSASPSSAGFFMWDRVSRTTRGPWPLDQAVDESALVVAVEDTHARNWS